MNDKRLSAAFKIILAYMQEDNMSELRAELKYGKQPYKINIEAVSEPEAKQ